LGQCGNGSRNSQTTCIMSMYVL